MDIISAILCFMASLLKTTNPNFGLFPVDSDGSAMDTAPTTKEYTHSLSEIIIIFIPLLGAYLGFLFVYSSQLSPSLRWER